MTTTAMMWPPGWQGAATRMGIPVEEYAKQRNAGQRWCCVCSSWQPTAQFTVDRERRPGGISNRCKACDRARNKGRVRIPAVRPAGSGQRACALCPAAAPFVLTDGRPACARCLKARVKERKTR